ncbi:MAG TPA: hypothetical protein PKA41_19595 [Verrucomicrobiota bacterium]|nr:hypothetical protein [Verrucomicrobiota bacterium]
MKSQRLARAVLLVIGAAVSFQGKAQFYAPDTEYHDPVQRVFVVEAARVLAWCENLGSDGIAEVSYAVTNNGNGDTVWHIEWRDLQGKVSKTARVEYPVSLLTNGVGFYRQTFKQLQSSGWSWRRARQDADPETAFWTTSTVTSARCRC